ncbi:MAG: KpsF/GutQ family sugar-phosphate isomerase [Achromobacter pulmonis]|jgi:arabinose-5-phosphate isomerase|uniref:Arabinose 5-phosphate isomerase KdsD n=1 Tax=Achromobacter pulmonis TaxID=1389932 RepID=A0A6S7DB12_9BURK|nr:KpsF/GutQ family sugar-phosphate isomerase [Achromobacter pulmonis]MCF7768026.1 KpsF/GutQ family sugar-phosphate isomerase [Achromobacter pulmonis]CAB3639022.1 Arabinose 5-phosphate isomerase KdsD [Achromobacter pulmonis]CAB3886359.1 Arabinose 5-phosphate isomerase KdsD [Achromobacter pulmonis]
MTDHPTTSSETALASARRTLQIESQGILDLSARLDDGFARVVAMLLACRGRVVVSGIGKTGHIARKIAATLASTGTPAFFMHAAEAVHGDLGMITRDDVLIAISYSGSGQELLTILPVARRMGAGLVAITGNPQSELAQQADVHLDASVSQEACPLNLAPTASTTTALALGDALAVACLEARGFGPQDFARSHPGGALGRRLLTHVRNVMREGDALPVVALGTPVSQALEVMSAKGMGMTVVCDPRRRPVGIFTDGDLRRLIARYGDIRSLTVEAGMTRSPRSINPDALAVEAARQMDELRLNHMLVLDADGALLGALHMHDLMAAKVV